MRIGEINRRLNKLKTLIEAKKISPFLQEEIHEISETTWRDVVSAIEKITANKGLVSIDEALMRLCELKNGIQHDYFSVFELIHGNTNLRWYDVHEAIIAFVNFNNHDSLELVREGDKLGVYYKKDSKGMYIQHSDGSFHADIALESWILIQGGYELTGVVEAYNCEKDLLLAYLEPELDLV